MKKYTVAAGDSSAQGAHSDARGTNFALFSANAEKVELCLFDVDGEVEIQRLKLPSRTENIWHGFVPGLPTGSLYGYRVHGPYRPELGHRFNHHKLLIDPYARQLSGEFRWVEEHFGYQFGNPLQDISFDTRDNAFAMPKCVVPAAGLTESGSRMSLPQPGWRSPMADTIIYEAHVKGFTKLHPDVPPELRGTYKGMSEPVVIQHLLDLGITSIELQPVHSFIDEHFLQQKGLSNYWGYNTLNFFSVHSAYASDAEQAQQEFKAMVATYHKAGIEVILDVVYNHTCEGDHLGPTLSFKGIDNASYYSLDADNPRFYHNDSGCGNTINCNTQQVTKMILDSLRYWGGEMAVDGFRFDLAPVLGRSATGFDADHPCLAAINADHLMTGQKLFAEPWDLGPGGYQLGKFPAKWSEWNDRYRDTVRRFWRGDKDVLQEFSQRLLGSHDIFNNSHPQSSEAEVRKPQSSLNFITSHDGFSLRDSVSFVERHNELNLESNADGHRANYGINFGFEGLTPVPEPSADQQACKDSFAEVEERRRLQLRNLLATLFVSQGIPMLLMGDEMGRTQRGNNNAYCQDNELTWLDWSAGWGHYPEQIRFTSKLIKLRQRLQLLRLDDYPRQNSGQSIKLDWLDVNGRKMQDADWRAQSLPFVSCLLQNSLDGQQAKTLLVIFNNDSESHSMPLPPLLSDQIWWLDLDTRLEDGGAEGRLADNPLEVAAHSVLVLTTTQKH